MASCYYRPDGISLCRSGANKMEGGLLAVLYGTIKFYVFTMAKNKMKFRDIDVYKTIHKSHNDSYTASFGMGLA